MEKKARSHLARKYRQLVTLEKTFLGYPCDAEFDYAPLYKFLKFPLNNVGDPYEDSTYRIQTKEFEREVLKFFAKLLHIRKNDYWGYITNGGTEGNQYGLYAARETLPKAPVFFSDHTHYSVKKNVHILRMNQCIVRSQPNGEMDYEDFAKKIRGRKTAIVVANIGTTMTGAVDDIQRITEILEKHKVRYYIHADAALYGMVLPFCSDVKFDFRTKINSIAISGHKFLGSPVPCGILLARKESIKCLQNYIEYIGAHDTTLSGSRDAFTPLVLWYRLKTKGLHGFRKQVKYSLSLADYLVSELEKIGWPNVGKSYITVWFERPSQKIVNKWELAANKDVAHVICLPHESKKELHKFVMELHEEVKSAREPSDEL